MDISHTLFAQHADPMWAFRLDTKQLIDVNEAALTALGYSREAFLGLTLDQLHPPDDVVTILRRCETAQAYTKIYRGEPIPVEGVRVVGASGSEVQVDLRCMPVVSGEIITIFVLAPQPGQAKDLD